MPKPFHFMPGPRGVPIIGSAFSYSRFGRYSFEKLHLAKQENFARYGKIYKERLGPGVTIVQVFDPEDVGRVFRADGKLPRRPALPISIVANKRDRILLGLGSLNGKEWYDLRSAVQKLMMLPNAAATYLPAQNAVADDFRGLLRQSLYTDGEVSDFFQVILKYAMESIGTVCFGTRLGCLEHNLAPQSLANQMIVATTKLFEAAQKTAFAFPWYALFRTKLYVQYVESKNQCDRIAEGYINVNRCPHLRDSSDTNFVSKLVAKENLSIEQVLAITAELFTAGIDSTANALTFGVYNLARNPKKQEILREEIATLLPKNIPVTADVIDKMIYLKACVKESFRLHFPIEGGTTRILTTDLILSDYIVPKGTLIAMNNQTMCLQEEYFDRPKDYIPERWLKSGTATLRPPPKFVLLPFGYGARMCIGRRFAEQEIYLALIKILQAFKIEYHHEEVGMINRVFTTPDRPLKIKFIPIN